MPATVLLIEDSRLHAELVQAVLQAFGPEFDVEWLGRLDEGLHRLARGGIDVVLLDLNLPDSEGLNTFHRVHDRTDVPVVVLTAVDDEGMGISAVRMGAQDYLMKNEVSRHGVARSLRYAVERGRMTAQLQAANQALKDFISIASHELRNPLAAILMSSELLTLTHEGPLDEAESRDDPGHQERRGPGTQVGEAGRRINELARHILRLADDLLTTAAIESGTLRARPEVVSVREVLEKALAGLAHVGANVQTRCPEELRACADAAHLEQILGNYISNAAKYGAPPILVEAEARDGWVEIRVRDGGKGLEPEFARRAFERFSRAEGAWGSPGTGLGLFICREMATAGGGEVWYEPDPRAGSCFGVRFPDAAET